MNRSPPRGPRGGQGGGSRRGGGGGRDSERYGGRATDPYHSRKRSRSRSPESRNHRDHYRERGDRDRERGDRDREYPKYDGGRGNDREYRGGGPRRGGGRDYDAPPPPERERDRDREYPVHDRGGPGRDDDKPRRYRSRSRDRRRGGDRDRKDAPPARSRSRDRHTRRRSPSPAQRTISPPPATQDIEMTGDKHLDVSEENDVDAQLQAMMGIGGFGTTKQKKVKGNDVGAISKNTTVKYRQYMYVPFPSLSCIYVGGFTLAGLTHDGVGIALVGLIGLCRHHRLRGLDWKLTDW